MAKSTIRKDDSLKLLKELSELNGAPGFESEVASKIEQLIGKLGTVKRDRNGGIMVEKEGSKKGPRILLAAHMDEVALMVKGITEGGLVKFVPLGGWWAHVLPSHRVNILTAKGVVPGVIGAMPPHHLSAADKEKIMATKSMVIDVGATDKATVLEMGIEPGLPIIPAVEFTRMAAPDAVSGKAFDDRVGVAMMIEIMRRLNNHPNTLIAAGTVQEEVGTRGAKTMVNLAKPDIAIILEGPPTDDLPGCAEFVQGAMGKGPQIRAFDPTMITRPALFNLFKNTAVSKKIPHQIAVRDSGGTDAAVTHLHADGVPSIVIGVPVRYAHSHVGILSLKDFEASIELVCEVIMKLDSKMFDKIIA
ncbi:MAG: M20/M25/M40 family metallo-hydrolase [Candidatus Riflebacteria bacterium]|nr:M20/M25/M40 family metallo-hydrolase [Candidatus Riflebacteria bacterium]